MKIHYRKGTLEDSHAVFRVFVRTLMEYSARMNVMAITGGNDPEVIEALWNKRRSMFEFLASTAAQFWVAEKDGEIVAYARSIEHGGLQELTEFFVSPDQQSAGVGGELLRRAFPLSGARYRTIIATLDERALYRYMKLGVYGRFPLKYFSRKAETVDVETDLTIEPLQLKRHIDQISEIDRRILNHGRAHLHHWIAADRQGFVYQRGGDIVGYGYVGSSSGPFALLDGDDFPAVLAHAESLMAEQGKDFGAEAPLLNEKAVHYFVHRKYEIDSFSAIFMSNVPFGRFENYLCFSPEFFL
ncbi:MAG TPA: GNAT family N-acetyltransferase [Anaerolineales bacterium]|nr:GNAT family N-acetyltransferase [Anaerolineales bacterium]